MQPLKNDVVLYPGERLDDLERNGLKIIQRPDRFCFVNYTYAGHPVGSAQILALENYVSVGVVNNIM